jgi:hypothetical protein
MILNMMIDVWRCKMVVVVVESVRIKIVGPCVATSFSEGRGAIFMQPRRGFLSVALS